MFWPHDVHGPGESQQPIPAISARGKLDGVVEVTLQVPLRILRRRRQIPQGHRDPRGQAHRQFPRQIPARRPAQFLCVGEELAGGFQRLLVLLPVPVAAALPIPHPPFAILLFAPNPASAGGVRRRHCPSCWPL